VKAVEQVVAYKAKEKELEFIVNCQKTLSDIKVIGDPARFKQVLLKLCGNAVKFCHRGYVKLECTIGDVLQDSLDILISIEDTGIGIPKDRMDKLFKSFTQVDSRYYLYEIRKLLIVNSTTRNFGGTGLGLFIAHQFVTLLGGDIKVSSIIGEGTTFYLRIPFKGNSKVNEDNS
jgi:two-component system sensor histidine kinase/response regulator